MFDSMMNFMIQLSSDPACQCFIGIFTTVVFHYAAWVSIFLRAFRIGKFFDIYERYLDNSEKEQLQNSVLRLTLPVELDTKQDEEEDVMLKEFESLKESRYIKRHLAVFICIISAVGIASFFIPTIYAIVPVYET